MRGRRQAVSGNRHLPCSVCAVTMVLWHSCRACGSCAAGFSPDICIPAWDNADHIPLGRNLQREQQKKKRTGEPDADPIRITRSCQPASPRGGRQRFHPVGSSSSPYPRRRRGACSMRRSSPFPRSFPSLPSGRVSTAVQRAGWGTMETASGNGALIPCRWILTIPCPGGCRNQQCWS